MWNDAKNFSQIIVHNLWTILFRSFRETEILKIDFFVWVFLWEILFQTGFLFACFKFCFKSTDVSINCSKWGELRHFWCKLGVPRAMKRDKPRERKIFRKLRTEVNTKWENRKSGNSRAVIRERQEKMVLIVGKI